MKSYAVPGAAHQPEAEATDCPLVVLFERDDAIAVPLLSQVRMAGYDVRAARTPVDLFSLLGKHVVSLVLVDLGAAAAGRREFWVALDAQRRGRTLQVMTFRFITPPDLLDMDFEPAARALADVEVQGAQEFQKIVEGIRQRVPLQSAPPAYLGGLAPGMVTSTPFAWQTPQPSPFAWSPSSAPSSPPPYGQTDPYGMGTPPMLGHPFGQAQAASPWEASPFAQPASANPFAQEVAQSAFAQPYAANPFAAEVAPAAPGGHGAPSWQTPPTPMMGTPMQSDPTLALRPERPPSYPSGEYAANYHLPVAEASAHVPYTPFGGGQAPTPEFADRWTPPETDLDGQTGVVPEVEFTRAAPPPAYTEQPWAPEPQPEREWSVPIERVTQAPTAPVPAARMPARAPNTGEQALGTVLVEGALLSPQKLEALQGVQAMLAGSGMSYKLGELALLFKFLSPDQLLAALLVSRGLVTPQQIAGLGRVKQELAASGMDHDLETLLGMFHILPPEQLHALRAELA